MTATINTDFDIFDEAIAKIPDITKIFSGELTGWNFDIEDDNSVAYAVCASLNYELKKLADNKDPRLQTDLSTALNFMFNNFESEELLVVAIIMLKRHGIDVTKAEVEDEKSFKKVLDKVRNRH